MTVTVCIPSIPPRAKQLVRALASVTRQTRQPDAISVALDHNHEGAARTRNRAWQAATTEFVAFMDDDDVLYPVHLEHLLAAQADHDADVVWPWFDTSENFTDPFPMHEGRQYDHAEPHIFPITTIVRRELIAEAGGFIPRDNLADWEAAGEDWYFWLRCRDLGARFWHLEERTWKWNFTGLNTSGRGDRW